MKNKTFVMFTVLFLAVLSFPLHAQVAINTDGSTYDVSAMLDVKSSNKGFLPPRVALTAVNVATPVTSPAVGLMVYNTATAGTAPHNVFPGYYCWSGSKWMPVNPPQGASSGDMLYWNGTQWAGIPVGATGQSLVLVGSMPTWGQAGTSLPTVMTIAASNLSSVSAISGGNVTDGGSPVTARGVCWSASANPTISDPKTSDGIGAGAFTSNITGLIPNSTYHVRAYATNTNGTNYGSDFTFTTINIVTTAVTAITTTSATSGGTIASDGGNPIIARGVCWNTFTAPTLANSFTTNGSGTGTFTSNLTSLTGNTTYYLRAYITNGSGTFYGNELSFVTSPVIPTLTTSDTSNVTKNTAQLGGTITNDGGSPVLVRGVCWNTSSNPTISHSKTTDGSGLGSFVSVLTGLNQSTTYYVRAYATNANGTAYGANVSFMTKGTAPTVTTDDINGITQTTAIAFGTVTTAGSASVTERGFCWKTSPNPTTANSKVTCGTGAGSFNGSLTVLAPNTTYYVRAYAITSAGTAYGATMTCTTQSAYYVGFETGWPTGWFGNWTIVPGNPYDGYYSLTNATINDTVSFTRTITTVGGQISFYYKAANYPYNCYNSGSANTRTEFYIDNIKQGTYSESSWTPHYFGLSPGAHTFKWKNIGYQINDNWCGGTYNGSAWIDFIICPN